MKKSLVKQRIFPMLLAGLICTSMFSACSNKDKTGSTSGGDGGTSSSTSNSPESEMVNKEGLPIVNEPIDVEIVIRQMSTLKDANDKQCAIDAAEKTGVNIKWTEIPGASYDEKVNILFASDALPDAICGGLNLNTSYGNQLVDLKPYMDDYAPTTSAFFEKRPEYPQALTGADGTLKLLPIGDEYIGNTIDSQLWINQDWLKNLGLNMPTTTKEFEDVLKAFKEQDANGDGDTNDEIPFTFKDVWGWAKGIESFMGSFGVVENDNHVFLSPDDDKTVVFGAEEQGYYDFLKWTNEMYKQGLIDPEVFTHSDDQYYTKNSGKDYIGAYIEYGDGGLGTSVSSLDPEDQKFKHVVALKGPNGDQNVGLNNLTREAGIMVTNKCKTPEAIVRWYDWVNTDLDTFAWWRWGKENEVWKYVDGPDGEKVPQQIDLPLDSDFEQFGYQNGGEYDGAEGFSGWSPALAYVDKAFPPEVDRDRKRPAAEEDVKFGLQPLPAGIADPENEDQRALLKADLDNYLLRFISDSMINGIDDAKWENHLKELEKLRVPEYKELCQAFVDEIQSR